MVRHTLLAAVMMTAAGLAMPALAAEDAELKKIREELKQMRDAYESRIQALEKRLQEAEAKAGKAEVVATQAQTSAAQAEKAATKVESSTAQTQSARAPVSASAFNPEASLILQGFYAKAAQNPQDIRLTGYLPPTEFETWPNKRGFSLGESELVLSASVDPYFSGKMIASFTPEGGVEVEEAFFQTSALPWGFTLKGGRLLSGIGYQNEIHQHAWDFVDAPLAYRAFLNNRYTTDGVQLRWLAPTPVFLEFGGEIGRGSAFPGGDVTDKNGIGAGALFVHVGDDIGASTSYRAGLSYLRTTANQRAFDDVDSAGTVLANAFSGTAKVWIGDFVVKWAPDGNATQRNFKLQGEYFKAKQDGTLYYDVSAAGPFGALNAPYSANQSGWYLQGVYQFLPGWRAGYRYDKVNYGSVNNGVLALGPTYADMPVLASHSPHRNTAMVDWSPTEFSRVRLQYSRDDQQAGLTNNQWVLQYIMSLGPHGAHRF
jgi:hypothetical protein